MNTNLVGEIFQTDILPEWINFETFHSYNDYTEVVIAYPNISPKVLNDAMNRLMAAKNPQLFIYGFGDGHYPTSNLPISTLTSNYVFQKGWTQSELRFKDSSIEGITKDLCLLLADVDKKEQIASYFDINYKLLSNNISPQIRGLIEKDLINQKMSCQLSSDKIIGLFPSVDGMKIELSESALSDIHAYIMGKLKISLDDTVIDSNLQVLHNQYPNDRLVKWVFLFLADRCPEIIARRIMKDAIMASHLNMNIIGAATDRGVKIHVKTLAVKSKTDVSRYEAGNMLMLLGVDSDIRKGFPNPFFVPKYPMQNRL